MTKQLEEALAAASRLSEEKQEAIAAIIWQQIAFEQPSTEALDNPRQQDTIRLSDGQEYPEPDITAYMERQAEIFERMKAELLKQYRGLYILFEEGQVLDSDESEEALVLRAFSKTGPRHLFVKKVIPEEPQLSIRGFSPPKL